MSRAPLDVFTCPLDGVNLIEASAGTGKTWNLCGLYLRLLLERGLTVDRILVVTFTTAATAELRSRIRERLAGTLRHLRGPQPGADISTDPFTGPLLQALRQGVGLADEAMALMLDRALQTFDEAAIFTIHGFSQRALADTPFAAGVPMTQTLLTDDSAMRREAVQDFWRRRVATDTLPAPLAACLLQQGDSPEGWDALLRQRLAKPLSKAIWPPGVDSPAAPSGIDLSLVSALHAQARTDWPAQREAVRSLVLEAVPRLNGRVYRAGTVDAAVQDWDTLLREADPLATVGELKKAHLLTPAKLQPKKGQAPVAPHPFFALAEALLEARTQLLSALALERQRLLRDLLEEAPAQIRQARREGRVVTFDDMLFNLHQRLAGAGGPALAQALRARFPAALIDEFQDTDPLQWDIFRTLYGDGLAPLFLVGDPKQAIYSFRNADLHTYLQARQEARTEYSLADNQRSVPALVEALNALFGVHERAFMLDGLAYQPVGCGAKPRPALSEDHPEPRAPLQLWALPTDDEGQPLTKQAARQSAATGCAGEIARLVAAGQRGEIRLDGRGLSAGDIAVLVRSHAQGAEMRRALAALGVGSVELSQASVFASTDAEELERVLAALLEPAREGLQRAALATELMGRDAAWIEAASGDERGQLERLTRATAHRQTWLRQGVGVMLRQWFVDEGVGQRLLERPDGERRLTNLLHLIECLHGAGQLHSTPEALLEWLQTRRREGAQAQGGGGDETSQLRLESDRHLVQIVTIHKSKGLEYPFVFCPFLWDGHQGGAPASGVGSEYHDDAGQPVIDHRDMKGHPELRERMAHERAAEQLRLIYVALTRAVQRCHVVVGAYRTGRSKTAFTESQHSLLNWLVAGAGTTPHQWLKRQAAASAAGAAMDGVWAGFAARQAGRVGLAPLPEGPGVAVPDRRPDPASIAALPPPARLPAGWWIGSYSSLAHGARHEAAAVDHDLRARGPMDGSNGNNGNNGTFGTLGTEDTRGAGDAHGTESADDPDDIVHFPRGPAAGECLHQVFERIDFTRPEGWAAAIASALQTHPQPGFGAGSDLPRGARMLERMLGDVLYTPLPGGLRLAQLPTSRRLTEMEFSLPAGAVTAGALSSALQAHGYPVPELAFGTLQGYLRGFIDLVFEHGGQYWVLDWKSNHLGDSAADYGSGAMQRTMARQGYHLQYLLYTVAVHRFLARRVPGYRYESHFGGVLYLFVRGVRPHWTSGADAVPGVFTDRPPLALVERLSALFASATREAA